MENFLFGEKKSDEFLKAQRYARVLGENASLDSVATLTYDYSETKSENPEIVFFTNETYRLFGEKKIALREPNSTLLFAKQLRSQKILENGKPHILKHFFGNTHIGTTVFSPEGFELDFYALLGEEVVRLNRGEFNEYKKIFKEFEKDFIRHDLSQQTGIIRNQVDKLFYELKKEISEFQAEIEIEKIQIDMLRPFPWQDLNGIMQKLSKILFAHFNYVGFPESEDKKRDPLFKKINGKYYYYNGKDSEKIFFLGIDNHGVAYKASITRDHREAEITDSNFSEAYFSDLKEYPIQNDIYI
ncbi:MAG: hypothetical protein RBS56_04160 [Candidatus Gracilibacteria bacterium]|jgi:hypothetical protein|nr:hypothetical protein [Candidatus Gracilibacteria bacterium]